MGCVSTGWWEHFRKQYPTLSLCQGESLVYKRAIATNWDVINKYFDLLEETISKNNHGNWPSCIFNCDESRMLLDFRPGKKSPRKKRSMFWSMEQNSDYNSYMYKCSWVYHPTSGCLQMQKLGQASLGGTSRRHHVWLKSIGWMDGEIFCDWLECHFSSL